jgi:Ion transport protein
MVVKISSLGFILNQGSYLRDAWNILDFVIIFSGYLSIFLQGSGVNLSALRSFRVIRPLRTISSVAGLRVIVSSLINALPLLRDSLLVLLFFFLVFAIAGCQLFTGALKNRCFNEDTGVIDEVYTQFCGGGNSCRPGFYCAKSNENPSNGATNFDNITFSLL